MMMTDTLRITQPRHLNFGSGCLTKMAEDLEGYQLKKIFVVTLREVLLQLKGLFDQLESKGIRITVDVSITKEPTYRDFAGVWAKAEEWRPDAVIGIGGGSVMDVAKLVAAQLNNTQSIEEITGINKLKGRKLLLICVPTTSGTGSEVSPNAILLDERDHQKKGIISPFLMPDMVFADPLLTVTLPPSTTAATGIDALTHCIEAYVNKFAHPLVDMYALEGIRLIGNNIVKACMDGEDMEARAAMMLGSLYGGICLGPVNTAAVHALSYPLGSRFHIAHGLSNALLLPHVIEFNLSAAPDRYAAIAEAMGCPPEVPVEEKAGWGIRRIKELMAACKMPLTLSEIEIPKEVMGSLAEDAMKVIRLLKNNVKEVRKEDAIKIYQSAY